MEECVHNVLVDVTTGPIAGSRAAIARAHTAKNAAGVRWSGPQTIGGSPDPRLGLGPRPSGVWAPMDRASGAESKSWPPKADSEAVHNPPSIPLPSRLIEVGGGYALR